MLQEIAKYTIGDDDEDEGFYDNWMDAEYAISDETESSFSEEEELGMAILRVVSCQQNGSPELHPNPSILLSSDPEEADESESESDEEQCRLDVLAAKQTLCATSHGMEQKLDAIQEQTENETNDNQDENEFDCTPKEPFLSGGDFSDHKISSDANNSDLP